MTAKIVKHFSVALAFLLISLLAAALPAQAGVHFVPAGDNAQERLQEILIEAEAGDFILLGSGTFELTDGLSLDVDNVTIQGGGADATILQFKDQQGAGEGLLITSNGVVLEDFAVENPKGDGIKSKGSDQITIRRVRVEWTNGPDAKNGAYGLYPVESKNVLIEECVVRGASDAGIYVGQSENIIVRANIAEFNVAGIEIENSYFADVHDNIATRNTGGILVFDLPNLTQSGGHSIRVFNNKIHDNDTDNFAPEGNIVGLVPRGTGMLIMANRNVHVFDNQFANNAMVHVAIVSYFEDYEDEAYYPHPRAIYVHNNTYEKGGFDPNGDVGKAFSEVSGTPVPDIIWDGVSPLMEWVTGIPEGEGVYLDEKEEVTFANLKMISNTIFPWGVSPDRDKANHSGSVAEPEPVTLPQLKDGNS